MSPTVVTLNSGEKVIVCCEKQLTTISQSTGKYCTRCNKHYSPEKILDLIRSAKKDLDINGFNLSPEGQVIWLYTESTGPVYGNEKRLKILLEGAHTIEWFKILFNRALNTWDDAPREIKSFVDQFIHGKELQDYSQQTTSTIKTPPKKS